MDEQGRRLSQVQNLRRYTDSQRQAIFHRDGDLLVTAGAGSGKTRTLVARYLALLAEGFSPQNVVAITFTEKAAREMRNRVRADLFNLHSQPGLGEGDQVFWRTLLEQFEGARIGTIHSLCAEIIRTFPAEAALDPQFEVVDEGLAAMYKNEAVGVTLAWAIEQPHFSPVFEAIEIRNLVRLLSHLIDKRLEVGGDHQLEPELLMHEVIIETCTMKSISSRVADLETFISSGSLMDDVGELMAARIEGFVTGWREILEGIQTRPVVESVRALFNLRRTAMNMQGGKKTSQAKPIFQEVRDLYDQYLAPWVGGAKSSDVPPCEETEERYFEVLKLIQEQFGHAQKYYQQLLAQQRALDFDDLEAQTHKLLKDQKICTKIQAGVSHVLVDEFQDTNQRQRDIILALAGEENGRLFLVGDAQQSIYRFRGADVEVFVEMGKLVEARGGQKLVLETTFRSHKPLLDSLDALLAPVIGEEVDPERPFAVPYSAMKPNKMIYEGNYQVPYVELVLGLGEDAASGREAASAALADRLIEMRTAGEIKTWDEVALLFRASSGYAYYEEAFAQSGIPYVTVAGRGFYDRPEIRDFLNVITAVANPWDGTAMAGFLRSPAIGLTDSSLLRLIGDGKNQQPFFQVLKNHEAVLPAGEQPQAAFALQVLEEFAPQVNRLSVSELMEKMVVFLNYRAILAEGGLRMVRNLDKMLEDARKSGLIQVGEFFEYLRVSRDVGVRTGEAASETQDSVQLMTIHKSKGLEFPLVVLADAAHAGSTQPGPAFLLHETGLSVRMSRVEGQSLAYNYARMLDRARDEAEANRLLYVACTRDQEKLIISGHANAKGSVRGYLKLLGCGVTKNSKNFDIDLGVALSNLGEPQVMDIGESSKIRVVMHDSDTVSNKLWAQSQAARTKMKHEKDLYKPVRKPEPILQVDEEEEESRLDQRGWRATKGYYAPAVVVGKLVHKAIQRWTFPEDDSFASLMQAGLVREGVVDPVQQKLVREETVMFLDRLTRHGIFNQVLNAEKIEHEVPYAVQLPGGPVDTGVIDLLYRDGDGWHILDFKTDKVEGDEDLIDVIDKYSNQLNRYRQACGLLFEEEVDASLVLLDANGDVSVRKI